MYWNRTRSHQSGKKQRINRNMRCIEMRQSHQKKLPAKGLIETWDVLKWARKMVKAHYWQINRNMRCIEIPNSCFHLLTEYKINRNMRCIEMGSRLLPQFGQTWINRNMRCIEISLVDNSFTAREWLIETWDVLKF